VQRIADVLTQMKNYLAGWKAGNVLERFFATYISTLLDQHLNSVRTGCF